MVNPNFTANLAATNDPKSSTNLAIVIEND